MQQSIKERPPNYRATVGDVVYTGIVGVLKAPDGDRFMVIGEHAPEKFVFDPNFLDIERSPDLIYIQVTSTVGTTKDQKLAFRRVVDELNRRLGGAPRGLVIPQWRTVVIHSLTPGFVGRVK